ncbi:MAG: 1-deoxy-D-xylulose-5-phosphate reductoisomerase [Planctomycetaceae bacterium]
MRDQCHKFRPRWAVLANPELKNQVSAADFPSETELLFGSDNIERMASLPDVETVISGIVGAAGLRGTWAAVEHGKTVGVANKETLVVAGPLVMELAREHGATLIPVDSEHSAIFQCLQAGQRNELERIVLTASGGPFRGWSKGQLETVTPEMAMKHPTWNMGSKITIDSATLMNKALEVIEARWLFELTVDQIEVVVHPQSIIHSFVEFVDGSVVAQLSPPDMKLPIQYALTYPERVTGDCPRMNWQDTLQLEWFPPDLEAFPALQLGFDVARHGGTCGAVLNAANEVAVERFLAGTMSFRDIPVACKQVLESHSFNPKPTLTELMQWDSWAREEIHRWS